MGLALKDNARHCYGDYLTWSDDARYEKICWDDLAARLPTDYY